MTTHGPAPSPSDRSFNDAITESQKDYARLAHIHTILWKFDLAGQLWMHCTCTEWVARTPASMESHIVTEIRRVRGPTRGPRKV